MNCRESLMNCSIQIQASIHFPDFRFSVRIFFLYLVTNLWFLEGNSVNLPGRSQRAEPAL